MCTVHKYQKYGTFMFIFIRCVQYLRYVTPPPSFCSTAVFFPISARHGDVHIYSICISLQLRFFLPCVLLLRFVLRLLRLASASSSVSIDKHTHTSARCLSLRPSEHPHFARLLRCLSACLPVYLSFCAVHLRSLQRLLPCV